MAGPVHKCCAEQEGRQHSPETFQNSLNHLDGAGEKCLRQQTSAEESAMTHQFGVNQRPLSLFLQRYVMKSNLGQMQQRSVA